MLDFYQAVASLLPVLALAWVVQHNSRLHLLDLLPTGVVWSFLGLYILFFALVIAGETMALNVLHSGKAGEGTRDIIEMTLVMSVSLLLVEGLVPHVNVLDKRTRFPLAGVLWAGWVAVCLAVYIVVFFT